MSKIYSPMKKLIATTFLSLTTCFLSLAQLSNTSFEAWNQNLPDGWFSALIPGYPVMVQSTDANAGAYCVQLNVVDINGNPYGSSISTGNANSFYVPISYVPPSINFWYKLNSVGGDQLSVLSFVYSGGNMVALGSTQMNGVANYTQVSLNLINLTGAIIADSIQVSFLINNPGGATHVGSSANIDDVVATFPTGILTNNLTDDFKIGPVPAKDKLHINMNKVINTNLTGIVYDMNGSVIKTIIISSNTTNYSFDINEIPNGNYVLRLLSDGKSCSKVFSIEK